MTPVKKTNGTTHWDPFDMFDVLHEEMERFWPRAFPFFLAPRPATSKPGMGYMPRMDVFEKDNTLFLKTELPGLKKEDVQVQIEDGNLVIKGETKAETEIKEAAYYRMERSFGSFYRTLPLPFEVTPDQVQATLTDGVLEVVIPKPVQTKPDVAKIPVT